MIAESALRWWSFGRWLIIVLCCIGGAVLSHRAASAVNPGGVEALAVSLPLLAVGLVLAWHSERRIIGLALCGAAVAGVLLLGDLLRGGAVWLLLLQHVGINVAMGVTFGRTLAPGSVPLVSRLAGLVHGPLTPRLAKYTRKVTWAWTTFFALTVLVSLLLFVTTPAAVWSGFVNLLSLPLLALMFAGEYLVRLLVVPRDERAGFFQAMAAYRKSRSGRSGSGRPDGFKPT